MTSIVKEIAWKLLSRTPFTRQYRSRIWIKNHYMALSHENMRYIFLSIARFAHINRPIDGYYMEFGSHEGRTMRLAWKHFNYLFNWDFVAFDSFEGLPEITEIDKQAIWQKGRLKTEEDQFIRVVTNAGMPREKLITVKGFYEESLTNDVQKRLLPKKAAVIYVDCDLYKSTIPVLEFIVPFLQRGTVIVFDDWNCFYGDPKKGERRAWAEFTLKHTELEFVEFINTNEAQSFICITP